MTTPFVDLSKRRFGMLLVVSPETKNGRLYWNCQCDCGRVSAVRHDAVQRQTSCGCHRRRIPPNGMKRHGLYGTKENRLWSSMIRRCTNPKQKNWGRYGGRGIKVCNRWLNSFEAFLTDMGKCPPGLTIERKDNDGNYEPGNCRWATQSEQANNTSRNHIIEFDGRRQTLTQWARELGIEPPTLRSRLKGGMELSHALTSGDLRRCIKSRGCVKCARPSSRRTL